MTVGVGLLLIVIVVDGGGATKLHSPLSVFVDFTCGSVDVDGSSCEDPMSESFNSFKERGF